MRACLAAGCHYIDLGGLYWLTGRQLELHEEFERAGLLALLGMGSSPGQDERDGRRRGPPAPGAGRAARRDGRRARPRPAARGPSYPYALQTLVDELTLRPVVVRGRRTRRRSSPSATAGRSTSASRSGRRRRSTRFTPSCARSRRASGAGRRASASRWRPPCSSGCASWRPRRPSAIAAAAAEASPPSSGTVSVHVVDAYSGGTRVRVRAVTEPVRRVGARRRGRLDRCSRSRSRAAAGAGPDRGARRAPSRTLRPARGPVPGAGAPGCPVRGDGRDRRARREGRGSHRDQARRVPRGAHAGGRARAARARPRGADPVRRRRGQLHRGRRLCGAGRAHRARRGRGLRGGRPGAEGQGAPARGGRAAAPGADPLHVPAPGGRRAS